MKVTSNLEVVRAQRLECEVNAKDILELVRQHAHIPEGATVRIYVDIPGGGDWSNMELDIDEHPVQVRAEWSVSDAPKQG